MRRLEGVRVAVLAADGFEEVELTKPWKALEKAGAELELVSLRPGRLRGMHFIWRGDKRKADRTVFTADPADYDALYVPGGFVNPDLLRQSRRALAFVRAFELEGKPIATMCHGPQVLISAGLVRGRRLASWPGIRDDVFHAGGVWTDEPVVVDANWISSRSPLDLREFSKAMVEFFARRIEVRRPSLYRRIRPAIGTGLAVGGLVALAERYLRERSTPARERGPRLVATTRRTVHIERPAAPPTDVERTEVTIVEPASAAYPRH